MNTDRLITMFCDLIKVPSETPDDKEFISYLEKIFKEEGAKTQNDDFGNLIKEAYDLDNNGIVEIVIFSTWELV